MQAAGRGGQASDGLYTSRHLCRRGAGLPGDQADVAPGNFRQVLPDQAIAQRVGIRFHPQLKLKALSHRTRPDAGRFQGLDRLERLAGKPRGDSRFPGKLTDVLGKVASGREQMKHIDGDPENIMTEPAQAQLLLQVIQRRIRR
ncbi:hypothetical protein SDC9_146415 [bioreactor metagenome]|uniref:Uncharacterized protein n=1 Tax=bioreactor metagenome TaxID=1076179 RepID=A0A645EAX8_9ZZZZ